MKIVAISSLGANHRFVLQELHQTFPLLQVLQPTTPPQPRPASRASKVLKILRNPVGTVQQRLSRCYQDSRLARLENRLNQDLFPTGEKAEFPVPCQQIRKDQLHSSRVLAEVAALEPDLILTSGCPLLKPELFELPRFGTINIHWGIAPAYRGEHTLFWPLYYQDAAQIGVTIHQIDRSIDGGPILAQGWPKLAAGDDEATLEARIARMLPTLLTEVLRQIETTQAIRGTSPVARGRIFRRAERRWKHDLTYHISRSLGLRRLTPSVERECYTMSATKPSASVMTSKAG